MNKEYLELYTDYLIRTFGAATATGLAERVSGALRHDRVTRCLAEREYPSRELGLQVQKTVPEIEQNDAVLSFEDPSQKKLWTAESE